MPPRHPLQRLASPSRTFSFLVHTVGTAAFLAAFQYLQRFPVSLADSYGGHYQFLTIIGLALALLSFVCGVLGDLTLIPLFFDVKNGLTICAAPLEVLISTLYWSIVLVDKSLLFPPELQLPFLPDVGFHAAPAALLTVDVLLFSPPWAITARGAMAVNTVLAFLYWGWVEWCFSHNGFYPYPLFELLSTWQRVLLFTFSACLMTVSTMILKWVYGKVNGLEERKRGLGKPGEEGEVYLS